MVIGNLDQLTRRAQKFTHALQELDPHARHVKQWLHEPQTITAQVAMRNFNWLARNVRVRRLNGRTTMRARTAQVGTNATAVL